MSPEPAWPGYFADPFLLRTDDGWVAYGSSPPFTSAGASVQALISDDLVTWRAAGTVFTADPSTGTDIWAPEVLHTDDVWWMYFSAGFGIDGHHVRVARAKHPLGPFVDCGVNLTPDESFAIDAHPFTDAAGDRWLFYARDVLDAPRPGTHLAVRRMVSPTELEPETVPVLAPNAEWQMYEANRAMYDRSMDWYTLEGPTVIQRGDRFVLLYSGGSWEGPDYGVSAAVADSPAGPWRHLGGAEPLVLSRAITGQRGPGHNSVLTLPDGTTVMAYHAWNDTCTVRQMHIRRLHWNDETPVVAQELLSPRPSWLDRSHPETEVGS